ncbi:MAG: hypothetical protein KDK90_14590, partial [Leptospiraceae bacterium]|nr:hypothetical protein [Leptospiraceae bacterium]
NQYTYTEGNPVRFTDPSGYMSYASFTNRVTKDFMKAAIVEVSKKGDIYAAGARYYMNRKAIKQEKKIQSGSVIQIVKCVVKIIVGVILMLIPGFEPLGVSLFASGLAGLGSYMHTMSRTHDKGKALRESKMNESVVGMAFFLYSFFDWGFKAVSELLGSNSADTYAQALDKADKIYEKMGERFPDTLNFSYLLEGDYYVYLANRMISYFEEVDLTLGPINLTNATGLNINFPGYGALFFASLDTYTITTYNHDVFWSKKGHPSYYYRESIRKGLYSMPYTMNFLDSGGMNKLFGFGGWGN